MNPLDIFWIWVLLAFIFSISFFSENNFFEGGALLLGSLLVAIVLLKNAKEVEREQ